MVAVLLVIGGIAPLDGGPIAIAQLLSPHLALACLAFAPIAVLGRSRSLGLALGLIAALFVVRFGGEWWSTGAPARSPSAELRVATWNLEAGVRAGPDAVAMLIDHPADLVALEELTPEVAAAIESDPVLSAEYPFRALSASDGVAGIGLLSRFRISSSTYELHPVRLEVVVELPDGGDLTVLAAHPFPARITRLASIPFGFDPNERNADLDRIRQRVAELDAGDVRVLLIGDFNTAPTEPAFGRLVGGLHDAHGEAGVGPGWTWRPARLAFIGIGLLRIDLVLSTSEFRATRTFIDCPPVGDHCLLEATLAIEH